MITLRRRPRWIVRRTRLTVAAISTTMVIGVAITGSVIGAAHADPDDPGVPSAERSATPTATPSTTATPTSRVAGGQAGTVYANRIIPGSRLFAGAREGNQFTYWSVGADGAPHLTTGSLYLPTHAAPRGGYPIVVWAHGSRGIADDCAPSLHPTDTDVDALRTWLARGYAVVSTDYAGLGTSGTPQYFDLDTTARNIIDAVRAGRDISDQLSHQWAVVGEGQGASAAVVLARSATGLQGGALDYRGSAATSIPAEFASVITRLGPATTVAAPSGWVAEALYTLASIRTAHPAVGLDSYLSETGRTWLSKAATLCAADLTTAVNGLEVGSLFAKPLSDNTALTRLLNTASTLPTRGFTRPVLMTQTLADPTVIVPLTLKYINDARLADSRVDGRTYLTPVQSQAQSMSADDTRAFLTRVLR